MSCQKAASTAESVQTLMSLVYCVTNLQCAVNAYVSRPQHCRLHLGPALDTFLSCLQQHHYNCKRGNIYCDLMYHHSWSTIVPTRVISKIPCSYVSLLSTLEVLAKKKLRRCRATGNSFSTFTQNILLPTTKTTVPDIFQSTFCWQGSQN